MQDLRFTTPRGTITFPRGTTFRNEIAYIPPARVEDAGADIYPLSYVFVGPSGMSFEASGSPASFDGWLRQDPMLEAAYHMRHILATRAATAIYRVPRWAGGTRA